MKLVILIALIALAVAAPAEKKPVEDKKGAEKTNDKAVAAADEKKPAEKPTDEKKDKERKGLHWPLPDPDNEGDLMLHGAHLMDRVEELHKEKKVDKEEDKMILSVGREYLRRVHKYIEKVTDFKIVATLCRDSERMNSTQRWEIRSLPKTHQCGRFCLSTDDQPQKQTAQTEQGQTSKQQQNDQIVGSSNNITHENVTDEVNATEIIHDKEPKNFEAINKEFYQAMGDNFARILMKRFRKEKLEKEETEWLNRWTSEEAVHYGWMGIYCHDGENVKDLTKRISTLIEEKQ